MCKAMFAVVGVEQRFYRSDADCIAAGKPLVEFELYQSTVLPLEDKGIRCRVLLISILYHNVVVFKFSVSVIHVYFFHSQAISDFSIVLEL